MNLQKKYELKIESAINGGSFSLWSDGVEKAFLVGDQNAKKSDYLIENISVLLQKNNVDKSEIKKIIYSDHPVSQTGLKILSSILKGFGTIYSVDIDKKNLFDCISDHFQETVNEKKLIILPTSTNKLEFALFDKVGDRQSSGAFSSQIFDEAESKINDSESLYIYAIEEDMQKIESEINASATVSTLVFIALEKNLSQYL